MTVDHARRTMSAAPDTSDRRTRRPIEPLTARTILSSLIVAAFVASVSVVVGGQLESRLGPATDAETPVAAEAIAAEVVTLDSAGMSLAVASGATTITPSRGLPVSLVTRRVGDTTIESVVVEAGPDEVVQRSADVAEWVRSVEGGFEHGYTIEAPVSGDELTIDIDVVGGEPVVVDGEVAIVRDEGAPLAYRDLHVFDADGRVLPSSMAADDVSIVLTVDVAGASYPVTIDPIIAEDERVNPTLDTTKPTELVGFTTQLNPDGGGNPSTANCAVGAAVVGLTVYQAPNNPPATYPWIRALQPRCATIVFDGANFSVDDAGAIDGPLFGNPAGADPAGGTASFCAAGSVVTGLRGTTGSWVDSIQIECAPLNADGTLGAAVALTEIGNIGPNVEGWNRCLDDSWAGSLFGGTVQEVDRVGFRCYGRSIIDDRFGQAVDVDGDLLAVGAPGDDRGGGDAGAVYVYKRSFGGEPWMLDAVLTGTGGTELSFGRSVAVLDGSTSDQVAVGDSDGDGGGRALLYTEDGLGDWGPPTSINSPSGNPDGFGWSLDFVDASRLVIGAPFEGTGKIYEYDGALTEITTAATTAVGDEIGYSLAVSPIKGGGYRLIAGAPGSDSGGGAIYLYRDNGPGFSWTRKFSGYGPTDRRVGTAVDVSYDRIVYGGFGDGAPGTTIEVWVHETPDDGANWPETNLVSEQLGSDVVNAPNDWVSIDGGTVAVGIPGSGGEVRLIRTDGTTWTTDDVLRPADRGPLDRIGFAVELDGRTIAAGAPGDDAPGDTAQNAGAAFTREVSVVATALDPESFWFNSSVWDVGVVPRGDDVAIVPVGVEATLDDNVTISQVIVDGNLYVDAPLELTGDGLRQTRVNGTLDVNVSVDMGSSIAVEGDLFVNAGGTLIADGDDIDGSTGTVHHDGTIVKSGTGTLVTSSGLTWMPSSSAVFDVVDGDVQHGANLFPIDGVVNIAPGSVVTFLSGIEMRPTGVVDIGVSGPANDTANYGIIDVSDGSSVLDGTLAVTLGGFLPAVGDRYPIMGCLDCFNGTFAYDTGPFDVIVEPTVVSLEVLANKLIAGAAGAVEFGYDVDIDGEWAVVGEPDTGGGTGVAHVLRRDDLTGAWSVFEVLTAPETSAGLFGSSVAIDGNRLAVSSPDSNVTFVYTRYEPGAPFSLFQAVAGGADVDISGARLLTGDTAAGVPSATVHRFGSFSLSTERVLYPAGPSVAKPTFGISVAIDGDRAVVGAGGVDVEGAAYVFGTVEGNFDASPIATLTSPDGPNDPAPPTNGRNGFGYDVDIDGQRIVVGEHLNGVPQGAIGAVWLYDTPSATPVKLTAPDGEGSDQFGSSVDLDGDTLLVGAIAAQKLNFPIRDGNAYVFQRSGSGWVHTAALRVSDGQNGDAFGGAVALDGDNVLVGAYGDNNTNGPRAGAVYWFDAPEPLIDASLSLGISVSDPTPTVGVSSISVADLPPAAFQGYGGTAADYAGSDLQTIDLRADLGDPTAETTPIADVTLGQLALDTTPVTRGLLDTILLTDIPHTDGWSQLLVGPTSPPLVEQSLTLLAVLDDPVFGPIVRGVPLSDLDLGANNLGSISTYAALLAGVPVTQLPDPSGNGDPYAFWCSEAGAIALDCGADFGVTSAANDALTLPVLSFAGVDIDDSALLGVRLDNDGAPVDLSGTAIGELSVGDLALELVPLASQPLVPSKALPSFSADSLTVPSQFGPITLGELGDAAPLAALDPANVLVNGQAIGAQSVSALDLEYVPGIGTGTTSPIQDYSWAPPALGAGLLLSYEPAGTAAGSDFPATVANVPLKDVGLDLPVLAVPLNDVTLPSGKALGQVKLGELLAQSAPFGASPFGASPFGASPFGASPFGASPFGASPFGASPFGASPFGASPFGASPFGASTIDQLGLAVPITALPLDQPIGAVSEFGALTLADLDSSNLLFDLPIQTFLGTTLLDCDLIDCRAPGSFTIGDAVAAGAMLPSRSLSDIQPGLYGLSALDLVGAHPALTESALTAYVAAQDTVTIGDVEDDPTLSATGIPIQLLDVYPEVTLNEARLLFSGWRLIDLAGLAVGLEQQDLDAALTNWNTTLTVGDLTGKLAVTDPATGLGPNELWVDTMSIGTVAKAATPAGPGTTSSVTVADAWPFFRTLRLEHVRGARLGDGSFGPKATLDATAGATPLGALVPPTPTPDPLPLQSLDGLLWGDIVGSAGTDPLPTLGNLNVADIVDSFGSVTLGEFLRAAQPIAEQQTEQIDLSSVDLAAYSDGTPVTIFVDIQVNDAVRADGVRVVATLPEGSRYVADSAVLSFDNGGPATEVVPPTQFGDTLIWQLANLQPDTPYQLAFEIRSPAETGIVTAGVSGQLQSNGAIALASTSIEYVEVFEPNDVPNDASPIGQNQIVLSQIGESGDVDLFRFDIASPGTRIGADLWDLPADYDLTIIGPKAIPLAEPSGRQFESVGDSRLPINGGTAANLADGGNYQPPEGYAVIARSTGRGTSDEVIEPVPVTEAGDYYLVVSGYDGAFSDDAYALRVNADLPAVAPPVCPAGGTTFPFASGADAPTQSLPPGVNTLFVINHERFGNQYGAGQADAVLQRIETLQTDLANPTGPNGLGDLGIVPGVVDLGAVGAIDSALAAWDAEPCKVDLANAVVSQTIAHLNAIYTANPGIEYVVMVGSDKIVPFARLADKTLLGNEQNYATTFGGDLGSPLYAALAAGTFFSDDPFVDPTPNLVNERALYVVERSVGRLVEDPASIIGQLDGFTSRGGTVRTDTALVTGYDFLADSAEAISDRLSNDAADGFTGPVLTPIPELISEDWTAAQLEAALIPPGGTSPGIGAVQGHFSHQGTQSALGSATDDATDALFVDDFATSDFAGGLIMTVGCHSGLSVDESVAAALGVDFAEVFSAQGAAAYVAQSGFGYGSTESIQLTERLLVDFATRLDGNFTVGEALKLAKNQYVSGLSTISVYDEKSLQQAILYGLPFATPDVANPPPPAEPPPTVELDGAPGGLRTSTFTAQIDVARRDIPGRGSVYEVDGQSYAPQEKPLQPIATFDTTGPDADDDGVPDDRLHGALLRGASAYIADADMDPVYQTPTIDDSANEPELKPADVRYPISPLGTTESLTEFGRRDFTVVVPGRFQAVTPDGRGRQAIYDDLVVETLHSGSDDWTPPTVGTVRQTVADNVVSITVTTPSTDVAGVVVAIVEDLPTSSQSSPTVWRSIDLAESDGVWSGGIELLSGCTDEFEQIVQVYDSAGNVSVSSNKASGFVSTCEDDPAPPTDPNLTVTRSGPLDASGWYTGAVTVGVSTTLPGQVTYRINGGAAQNLVGSSFTITGSGIKTYTVQVGGSTLSASGTVKIDAANVAPTVTSTMKDVAAAKDFTVNFKCTDVSLTSCTATLSGPSSNGPVVNGQKIYGVAGTHTLTVTADDAVTSTGPTVKTFTFEVTSHPPVIAVVTGPTQPELIGTASTIAIEFADLELDVDDYTVEFDFGKSITGDDVTPNCVATSSAPGTTVDAACSLTEPTATAPGTATATIVYPRAGVYTVGVTLTDGSGNMVEAEHAFVVIFDPGGGRVSGAGQFVSDESSYFGNGPAGSTKTTFGFKAEYDDDIDDDVDDGDDDEDEHDDGFVPEGKTKLKVKGAFKFKSTAYEYLVINDSIAVAEGVGKVDGVAGYRMRVQAIDNGDVDFFQITIWDPATDEVVYDNGVLYNADGNQDGDEVTKGNIKVKP